MLYLDIRYYRYIKLLQPVTVDIAQQEALHTNHKC